MLCFVDQLEFPRIACVIITLEMAPFTYGDNE